jgi:hypothetical protein
VLHLLHVLIWLVLVTNSLIVIGLILQWLLGKKGGWPHDEDGP